MKRRILYFIAPALLLAVGCAKAPADKMEAAERAAADAKTAGASTYMAEDYAKVEGLLANAKKEVSEQDAKFALLRDYGKAEEMLATVQTEASRVTADTSSKKEEAKNAAVQAQKAAQASVAQAQALVAKAPVGKDRAALEAIKADAQGLTTSLVEVQKSMDAGDYPAAKANAEAIQEKSRALAAEIQTALAKVGTQKGQKAKKGKPTRS